jgi:hypothetical protein
VVDTSAPLACWKAGDISCGHLLGAPSFEPFDSKARFPRADAARDKCSQGALSGAGSVTGWRGKRGYLTWETVELACSSIEIGLIDCAGAPVEIRAKTAISTALTRRDETTETACFCADKMKLLFDIRAIIHTDTYLITTQSCQRYL